MKTFIVSTLVISFAMALAQSHTSTVHNPENRIADTDRYDADQKFYSNSTNPSNTHFSAIAGSDRISLQWDQLCEDEEPGGYKILRAEAEAGKYMLINSYECNPGLIHRTSMTGGSHFDFTDLAVVPGVTYWYKLIRIGEKQGLIREFGPTSAAVPLYESPSVASIPKQFKLEALHKKLDQSVSAFQLHLPDNDNLYQPTQITIYHARGEQIKTLYRGIMEAGRYRLTWHGDSETGKSVRPGIYYAVFENGNMREAAKLVLVR